MKFQGTYTAIITPFRDGRVDAEAFSTLIEQQIKGGVDGIVPVGTTGESPTLSFEEHVNVIELAVRRADGRCHIMAGTGSNSTAEAIELTHAAERVGANSVLLVAPYYNKPPQEGLYQHFKAIADSTDLPVILYSIPGRCVVEIEVDTVVRLARDCKNIVGIKEAGGRVERVTALRAALPESFVIFSGDDGLALPFMREGAVGVISVASNVVPAEVSAMIRAQLAGDTAKASEIEARLTPLFKVLFLETNPIPVKAALALKGIVADKFRLPLVPMTPEGRATLTEVLKAGGWL